MPVTRSQATRHRVILIDTLREEGHSVFFRAPESEQMKEATGVGLGGGGGGQWRSSMLTFNTGRRKMAAHQLYLYNFLFSLREKYYFIHAISVHSSAGASPDSRCHLHHTNILINGSDVSSACSWGGWGWRGGWSRGPVRVYTIKLRWPWCWKHSLNCTLAPVLLPLLLPHTNTAHSWNKEAPVCVRVRACFLFFSSSSSSSSSSCWSQAEETERETERQTVKKREREREREVEKRKRQDILSGDPLFMKINLGFTRAVSFTTSPPPKWDPR